MEINQDFINQMIEKEIKKQVAQKIDKVLEKIIISEINEKLRYENNLIKIAKEAILSNEEIVNRVARSTCDELFSKLTDKYEKDDYDDEW